MSGVAVRGRRGFDSRKRTSRVKQTALEQRWYYQINVPPTLRGFKQWKDLKTRGLVAHTYEADDVETGEVQCYISNLNRNAKTFTRSVHSLPGVVTFLRTGRPLILVG